MDGRKIHLVSVKPRHHHKPYLLRHMGLLLAAAWLALTGLLGIVMSRIPSGQSAGVLSAATVSAAERPVFSFSGGTFNYDPMQLAVMDTQNNLEIRFTDAADSSQAAAKLTISTGGTTHIEAAEQGKLIKTDRELLNGVEFEKKTYEHSIEIAGKTYRVYSLEWRGRAEGVPVAIRAEGLQSADRLPAAFGTVLSSLSFKQAGKVLARQDLAAEYVVDAISPAVVKIYRITCGTLALEGRELGAEQCDASTGSGFFVSSNGHIATSGHVVTRAAEDILIDSLLANPASLNNFLKYLGLSDGQVRAIGSRPELMAAVIARLYEAPDEAISLENKQERLLVALGSQSLQLKTEEDAKKLLAMADTDHIKRAETLAVNYSPKDLFVLASGDEEGFSASDVALIKVNAPDTPYLKIFGGQVVQNQKISILGFPGDADNILTDNHTLAVTVTNGSINAIRAAAGSRYKLFQSDADASQGSSGGPVVNERGEVLGILTYRYKNASASDAAKSYIRDINDLKELAADKKITLGEGGTAQTGWLKGLELFQENRFTKATAEFEKVENAYPPHRLVSSYQTAAKKGIADGHDVKDMPFALAAGMSFVGAAGAGGAVILIARHHSSHLAYKLASANKTFTPHHAST